MRDNYQYDPDIGYRFVPGQKLRVAAPDGGFLMQTNAQGFRSPHDFTGEPADARRVLLFGDSFTAGVGVSDGKRYGDLLETLLPPLEVYNYAIPGTGTDQQFITYSKFARDIPCNAVVIAVLVENIRRIVSAYRTSQDASGQVMLIAKPYFKLEGGRLVRHADPVPPDPIPAQQSQSNAAVDTGGRLLALRKLVKALGLQSVVQRFSRYQPVPHYDSRTHHAWQLMRAILLAWRGEIRQPVVLMPIPLYQFVEKTADPSAYRARFAELAKEGDFILHDPLDDLWTYDAATRRGFRFKQDVHLTPEGHRAIAASLSKTLATVLGRGAG